jgi:hypothetical protein
MRKLCYLSFDPAHFPCARYRVLDPLERHRDGIALLHGINSVSNHTVEANTDAILGADAFLIQRSFVTPATIGFIDDLLRSGQPAMFETDDDLSVVPDWHNKPHHKESAKLAEPLLSRFAMITVSTEVLAERYRPRNANVRIVPNHLNEMLWAAARDGTVPGAPNGGTSEPG